MITSTKNVITNRFIIIFPYHITKDTSEYICKLSTINNNNYQNFKFHLKSKLHFKKIYTLTNGYYYAK